MIRYNASQIAALLGCFGDAQRRDCVRQIWQKHDPVGYRVAIQRTQGKEETLEEEGLRILAKRAAPTLAEITAPAPQRVEELQERKRETQQSLAKLLPKLAPQQQLAVKRAAEKTMNTNFGVKHESTVLERFAELKGLSTETDEALYCRAFSGFILQGRIDGWLLLGEERHIVEIKNRVYKLFHELRYYERMQLQTYLHLCDAQTGYLVEAFGKEIDFCTEERDDVWFSQNVAQPLSSLTQRLHELFENVEQQNLFFQNLWK